MGGDTQKTRTRGAADDLESLRLAVSENVGLFNRVMERIRYLRAQSKKTIFDTVKEKQAGQTKAQR